jgi:hypothetical protein
MSTARAHSRVCIRARAFFVDLPFHASCICHVLSLLLVHVHPMLHSLPVVSTVSNSLTPCPSPMRKLHIIDECVLVHHMERCQSVSSMLHTTWRFFLRHRWDIGTRHPPDLTYLGPRGPSAPPHHRMHLFLTATSCNVLFKARIIPSLCSLHHAQNLLVPPSLSLAHPHWHLTLGEMR